jgi:hypothetical protein
VARGGACQAGEPRAPVAVLRRTAAAPLGQKAWVENKIESLLKRTGNPWHIAIEDVAKDLFVTRTNFTHMDGFRRMVWTTAHFDRNHWNPE